MATQLLTQMPGYPDKSRFAAKLLLVALAYFVSGRLGLAIPYIGSHITLIWLPTGIAVAALMRWGYRCWPGVFLGALIANFSIDASPLLDCCIALGDTLAPLLVVWLMRRLKFNGVIERVYDILPFVVAAAAGVLFSASSGVTSLVAFKMLPITDTGKAWLAWWAGDFIGILLVTPLLFNISRAELKKLWAQRVEFMVWSSIMLAISLSEFFISNYVNSHSLSLAFMILPLIVWSAMRFGVMGSSLGVLWQAIIAAVSTSLERGTFYTADVQQGLSLLWLFLATLVLVNLIVAALQAQRTRANTAVQQSEAQFRQMFERHSSIMLLIAPVSGTIEDANAAASNFYGYPAAQLIGMNISQINTKPREEIDAERKLAMREERNYFIFPHRLANGEMRTVEVHSSSIEVAGHSVLFSIIHDITERQQIKEKTEALLQRYQTLLKTAMDGIYILDMQGDIVEANDAFCNMLGYSLAERLTLNLANFNAQYTAEQLRERLRSFIGKSARFETVHRCKSGRLIEVEISTSSVDIDGQYYFITSSRDISERKKIEQELRDSERTSRMLMDNAADAAFVADPIRERWLYINDRFESLLGYSRAELLAAPIYDVVTPEFRDIYRERFQSIAQAGGVATRELQLNRKDGSRILLEMSAVTLPDGNVHGSCRDITERKKIEEGQRIAAVTFDTQEAIMITNPDAKILRVNQAFQDITGYDAAEVIGCNPRIFQSGRHNAAFYQAMWSALLNTGKWSGEIWDKRKDGDIYPKLTTITAVYNDRHKVTNYVAVFRDITLNKKSEREIHQLAFYDSLTQLPNRRLLLDRLRQAMAVGTRDGRHGALLFLDLDHFKTINDTRGHAMGDQLLVEVARRLQTGVREGDSVARLGGDEFVVVLEDISNEPQEAASQTELVAEKIRVELDKPYILNGVECHSTVSIGISLFRGHQESAEDLLQHTDVAMYQAKMAGRNTIRFFDPQMQTTLDMRAGLEADLRHALEKQQFKLYYQIQVDSLRRALGAEALLRWQHPERGLVSPMEFIPLAEEIGLIVPMGLWVIKTACVQLKEWQHDVLTRDLTLAVNVSAKQFRQPDFVAQVQRALLESSIKPAHLKLEMTESAVLENVEDTINKMREIKALGVSFSMDDFGTGYSSLQYLKRLPLDQIKIDQSFVRDIISDPNDAAIVQTIIAMTEALGLNVIAEGVETESQRAFLAAHGCHAFQGYLFGRPVPLDQFESVLKGEQNNSGAS
jgi:diguanylate cyclase (GGDEF)-like protein/PAS domain S-box-containing protein